MTINLGAKPRAKGRLDPFAFRKILVRLTAYAKSKDIDKHDQIFPISYVAAWSMVKKAGRMVNIKLHPHDLRRHAAPRMLPDLVPQ